MHFQKGRVTRQAHVSIPDGTVEEEFGRQGFFGRVSHLYRTHPPVDWTRIEGDLGNHAFHATEAPGQGDGDGSVRPAILRNDDVTLRMARVSRPQPFLFRNADADEVVFVHVGAGTLECDFGNLRYRKGDYLVIPRGTAHRYVPVEHSQFLVVESRGEVKIPDRGLMGKHALFDPDVMEVPEPGVMGAGEEKAEWELRVQRNGRLSSIFYPHHPVTTVGWRGDLTVWRLNVEDIRPVLSERYHLPPSAHATFVSDQWVLCTFLPRPLETGDPAALRVPFYHSNIDFDEVLFYHDGEFFSRQGIKPGMVTFHPQGIHHGPQPGAVEAAKTKTRTNEIAVMVDTRRPLEMTEASRAVEDLNYWRSWMPRAGK